MKGDVKVKVRLFDQLQTEDKTIDFRENLLNLFDDMLNSANITDPEKLQKLAKVRARIEIELKDL